MPAAAATPFDHARIMYAPKIRTFASKTFRFIPGYGQRDLEQELLEVLWKCTLTYHPDAGGNFNTFFWRSAKNRTISIERQSKAIKRSAEWVLLDTETLMSVIDGLFHDFSAEEYALANLSVSHV